MARSHEKTRAKRSASKADPYGAFEHFWGRVTWLDLEDWAGSAALRRGRAYASADRVSDMARDEDGGVLAWVSGTAPQPYAVHLTLDASKHRRTDRIDSHCNCPVGSSGCKHAAALAVAWIEACEESSEVPRAAPDDPRLILAHAQADDAREDAAWETRPRTLEAAERTKSKQLREFISATKPGQLRRMISQAAEDLPEFSAWLEGQRAAESHDTDALMDRLHAQVASIAAEPDFSGGWGRQVVVEEPDWGAVQRALESALNAGLHDEVLGLVPEILEAGVQRINWDEHNDGLGLPVGEILESALGSLAKCSLSKSERIVHVYELSLSDEYDLLPDLGSLLKGCRKADWSRAADAMAKRIAQCREAGSDGRQSQSLRRCAEEMLVRAGRDTEVEELWVEAARAGDSALPLIRRYLSQQRWGEAEREALLGLAKRESPDSRGLRETLLAAVEGARNWPLLVALRAEYFRAQPSGHAYEGLCEVARKASRLRIVRKEARTFLERSGKSSRAQESRWSLAPVPKAARRDSAQGPHLEVRLNVALMDGTPDEVLRCHARLTDEAPYRYASQHCALAVAAAVSKSHPSDALALYQARVESLIKRAKPPLYREAIDILRTMRPLDRRVGPKGAWKRRIEVLREGHARKYRLTELLDGLLGRSAARRGGR